MSSTREQYRTRDVPLSCICEWTWRTGPARWVLAKYVRGCPWHGRMP